jgi:hypothetical protein
MAVDADLRLPRGSHTDTRFRQKLHLPPCPDFRDRLYGRLFCNMPVTSAEARFKGLHFSSFSPFSHCETTRNTSALFLSAIG